MLSMRLPDRAQGLSVAAFDYRFKPIKSCPSGSTATRPPSANSKNPSTPPPDPCLSPIRLVTTSSSLTRVAITISPALILNSRVSRVCPDSQQFKHAFWGHDEVVLHEHEIRKPRGEFLFLIRKPVRERFLAGLTAQMEALPATLVAVIIDKPGYVARYREPVSPYDYALETGLERVFRHLEGQGQGASTTAIIVEKRGKREDAELELAFRRVCDGANALHKSLPFHLVMIPKTSNLPVVLEFAVALSAFSVSAFPSDPARTAPAPSSSSASPPPEASRPSSSLGSCVLKSSVSRPPTPQTNHAPASSPPQ